jgi:hypothetical protein
MRTSSEHNFTGLFASPYVQRVVGISFEMIFPLTLTFFRFAKLYVFKYDFIVSRNRQSRPIRARGLKHNPGDGRGNIHGRAPYGRVD